VSEPHAFVRVAPLATHSSTATVGTPAPSFALPNASGERIALDDLVARGPVVLVFLRGFA
jgi:peroxiredoxin